MILSSLPEKNIIQHLKAVESLGTEYSVVHNFFPNTIIIYDFWPRGIFMSLFFNWMLININTTLYNSVLCTNYAYPCSLLISIQCYLSSLLREEPRGGNAAKRLLVAVEAREMLTLGWMLFSDSLDSAKVVL